MELWAVLVVISAIFVLLCSAESIDDTITVPLKVKNNEFTLSFPPNEGEALLVASKFCKDKGYLFGISEANFKEECLKPVGDFLVDVVKRKLSGQSIPTVPNYMQSGKKNAYDTPKQEASPKVELKIHGKQYYLNYRQHVDDPKAVASEFCLSKLSEFGLDESQLSFCVDPVEAQLKSNKLYKVKHEDSEEMSELEAKKKAWREKRDKKLGLKQSDITKKFGDEFDKPSQSLSNRQATINTEGTSSNTPPTVATEQEASNETITVTLDILGNNYDIMIKKGKESALDAAKSFCAKHMESLGISENTMHFCVDPVSSYLQQAINDK